MEVNGASVVAYHAVYDPDAGRRTANASSASDDDLATSEPVVSETDSVTISPEASRMANYDAQRPYSADDQDADGYDDGGDDAYQDAADAKPSSSKSFVYGALGLERPEDAQNRKTDGYDMGRWMTAGITVGTIISVLI